MSNNNDEPDVEYVYPVDEDEYACEQDEPAIRAPDVPRRDQLLPDIGSGGSGQNAFAPSLARWADVAPDPYDNDPELRTALMESERSLQDDLDRVLMESRLLYEMDMKKKHAEETERKMRKEMLTPFLDKWVPLSRIDPVAKSVDAVLMPAIEAYLQLRTDTVQLFEPEYQTVFSFLKKTRCPIDRLECLAMMV